MERRLLNARSPPLRRDVTGKLGTNGADEGIRIHDNRNQDLKAQPSVHASFRRSPKNFRALLLTHRPTFPNLHSHDSHPPNIDRGRCTEKHLCRFSRKRAALVD
jgi:hypothetical protein